MHWRGSVPKAFPLRGRPKGMPWALPRQCDNYQFSVLRLKTK